MPPPAASRRRSPRSVPVLIAGGMALLAVPLHAQDLDLKREVPRSGVEACPALGPLGTPSAEERGQAGELGSQAAQAVILGDLTRARDLLARAVELDRGSAELAYRYARVLEDLGERRAAVDELCRVVALDTGAEEIADAPARLLELDTADRPPVAPTALGQFESGLRLADSGRNAEAAAAFGLAASEAPTWAEASFNRGVALARAGRRAEAAQELRRYLELRPEAEDALDVSQQIGQLEAPVRVASAGTALTLGVLIPGMGQFYSGRALGGATVLAIAGGAAAAGFLIREIEVQCLATVGPGEDCPSGQVFDEVTRRPYLAPALGAAAAVAVIGAVEAFLRARSEGTAAAPATPSAQPGEARLAAPTVSTRGARVDLSLLRLRF